MTDYSYKNIQQIVESGRYPFTMGQMRSFLLNRDQNGLKNAVRKIGKRLLIRTDIFDEWIENEGNLDSLPVRKK